MVLMQVNIPSLLLFQMTHPFGIQWLHMMRNHCVQLKNDIFNILKLVKLSAQMFDSALQTHLNLTRRKMFTILLFILNLRLRSIHELHFCTAEDNNMTALIGESLVSKVGTVSLWSVMTNFVCRIQVCLQRRHRKHRAFL